MKKLFLFLFLLFISDNTMFAQHHPTGRDRHPSPESINITSFPSEWNYDTIICYDTSGLKQRMIQNCDAFCRPVEKVTQVWEGDWINNIRKTYSYDASGNRTLRLEELFTAGSWVLDLQYTYEYDNNSNLLSQTQEKWENGTWNKLFSETNTYDSAGNYITWLEEFWENGSVTDAYKGIAEYDSAGNMILTTGYHLESGIFVTQNRSTYSFDVSGNVLSEIDEEYLNNTWVNEWMLVFTYNPSGTRATFLEREWDGSGWTDLTYSIYSYNEFNHLISEIFQTSENGNWVNCQQYLKTYDGAENLTENISQNWDEEWINSDKSSYAYDEKRNSLTGKFEVWDGEEWVPARNTLYVYSAGNKVEAIPSLYRYEASFFEYVVGIEEKTSNHSLVIYPNPATSIVKISTANHENAGLISVKDLNGKVVLTKTMNGNSIDLDVSRLPAGIYVVTAGSLVGKLVVDR